MFLPAYFLINSDQNLINMATPTEIFKESVKASIEDKTAEGSILNGDIAARFYDAADLMLAVSAQEAINLEGEATPTTNPGASVGERMWITSTPGTYTNFGGIVIAANEAAFLIDTGSGYNKVTLPTPATSVVDALNSTSATSALSAKQGKVLSDMFATVLTRDQAAGVVVDLMNGIFSLSQAPGLTAYGYPSAPYVTQSADTGGLKLTPSGAVDSYTSGVLSGITWDAQLQSLTLTATLSAFATANPAVALGYGTGAGVTWFGYRSDGSITGFTNNVSNSAPAAANATYAFTSTSTVKIEISINAGTWRIRCHNGTVWTPYYNITFSPTSSTNQIVWGMRGGLTMVGALQKVASTPISVAEQSAKDYAAAGDAVLADDLDIIKYGAAPNKLASVPYTTTALTSTYTTATPGVTQTATTKGANITITTSGTGSLTFFDPGVALDNTKIYKLIFNFISTADASPSVGLCFGSSATPSYKGLLYRTSGQVFGLTIAGATGSLSGFVTGRSAATAYEYSASSSVEIIIDFPAGFVYTKVNGTTHPGLAITEAVSGNVFICWRDRMVLQQVKIVAVPPASSTSASINSTVLYVGPSGNDTNAGTQTSRLATITKALQKAAGRPSTKIIVAAGNYRETLDMTGLSWEKVEIEAEAKAVVRVLGSTAITGFTKTTGYTNIYEATFAGSIPAWTRAANPIFEDGNPSQAITAAERHPLQKGLTHRLPYTLIFAQTAGADLTSTLTAMDAVPGRYYVSGGKMYLHAGNSSNPASNGYSYEYIVRAWNNSPSASIVYNKAELIMKKIQFLYGTNGFLGRGFSRITRYSCTALAAINSGCWQDDACTVISYKDEAGGSDNDGFNGHYSAYSDYATQDIRAGNEHSIYFDPWSHDNYDDGISHHERHEVTIYGGLTEYNGDSGCRPSTGANWRIYNLYARKNGWEVGSSSALIGGEGIAPVNPVLDGRNSTSCIAFNCISEGNNVGYGLLSDSTNRLILVQCISRNNISAELSASQGTIISKNCLVTNVDPLKLKVMASGGTITIENDTLLT